MEDKWIWGAERYGNGWFVRNKDKPTDESWHFGMSSDAEQLCDILNDYENSQPNSHKDATTIIGKIHYHIIQNYGHKMTLGENLLAKEIFDTIYEYLKEE
ncbi:MAG: hypothetical protein J6A15_00485 [Clostridia bacterium]|nr:hypothetical protein [Clostridia bacterium]